MRKKAITNNNPEGRDQGVTLDPAKAPIVSPDDLEKITEPKGVPGEAVQGRKQEIHHPYTSLGRRTTTRFGISYDRFHIILSLQRLSEQNFLLSVLL